MVPSDLPISFGYILPPLLGSLVLFGLALLSLLRGARKRMNLLFAGICFLGALLNADLVLVSILPDERVALWVGRIVHLGFVFSVPIYICFVHAFLGIRERRWLEAAAWLFSVAFLAIVPTDLYFTGVHRYPFGRIARAGPLFHLFSAAVAFAVGYALILLFTGLRRVRDNTQKNRIKYVLGGLGLSSLLLALTILPVSGIPFYPLWNFSFIPVVFLAFGVLKYDLLDIGLLIRRGTVYFLLTGVLTALYILVIWLFQILFLGAGGGPAIALSLVLALIIVLLFNPLRGLVQRLIDRLFFRGRYNYRQFLREISGRLAGLLNQGQIRGELIASLGAALQVEGVSLVLATGDAYRLFTGGDPDEGRAVGMDVQPLLQWLRDTAGPLDRAAVEKGAVADPDRQALLGILESLGASLAVPIGSRGGLTGFIALGQKKSGELFVGEDLELLATVANQAATAIENAASYEALAALNRSLEEKVAARTAALRKALAAKERTQEQLIRSESLAAIGQLVAGTAHELNNPIAGAMSLVESSLETLGASPGGAENLREVIEDLDFSLRELRRAGQIIRSLLDLSRQTQTYVEAVDMNRAVDDALRILNNQFKNSPVEIRRDYQESLPSVEGNFANLGQVLINIILNAFQALPGGLGTITLSTRQGEAGGSVIVACRDSGVGIPAACRKDIFKPFFTTKTVGRGTGLGLYISHEIVRRHGGEIRVMSEQGRGTTVSVELPCNRRET